MPAVTLVELLDVIGDFDEVAAILRTVMARLEREGVAGLRSMEFYRASETQLAAVIAFADPADMLAHTAMVSSFPEFVQFAAKTKLVKMRIHGVVSPEVRAWMAQFPGEVEVFEEYVAGFSRPSSRTS